MTDSLLEQGGVDAAGKRERLIASAVSLMHQHGVQDTSLADIAKEADVPLGNVYYYFKTKDELVSAAIDAHSQEMRTALASLERHRTPKARLKAFVRMVSEQSGLTARYGCPVGTLCSELDKRDDDITRDGARLMALSIDWVEREFDAMGRRDSRELAVALIASYQGISLLTNTFRDPSLMKQEARRLERWIDSLA
jgi:AcrR family transcriptional regulator